MTTSSEREGASATSGAESGGHVAEANRRFYSLTAARYEATESHMHSRRLQERLESDLGQILRLLGNPRREIHCLDACAGTGTVTLKLLRHEHVRVEACDISPEMLEILRSKTAALGAAPTFHVGELVPFLERESPAYDLIVFSSALHHLLDYGQVLELCWRRLKPGGLVFTAFDPTPTDVLSWPGKLVTFADYAAFKLLRQTSDAPRALLRRLRRTLSGDRGHEVTADNVGALAEYHVAHGIDDHALVERMVQKGYRVLWHVREAEARSRLAKALLDTLGDVSSFKLLLERPASASPG